MLPEILAGSILVSSKAIDEFRGTTTFVSNIEGETRTIPSAMNSFLQMPDGDENAMQLIVVAACISIIALIAS